MIYPTNSGESRGHTAHTGSEDAQPDSLENVMKNLHFSKSVPMQELRKSSMIQHYRFSTGWILNRA